MELTSTPFIKYREINVTQTDLYDDAWGFNSEFPEVIRFLGKIDMEPVNSLTDDLLTLLIKNKKI
jgi:hypothetical protein